jgi:hypothetical protein
VIVPTPKFDISDERLANLLDISVEQLYQIIEFFDSHSDEQLELFDSHPNKEWNLEEGKDFIYLNRSTGIRCFSEAGAFAIAKYKDYHDDINWVQKVKEWITKHRQKVREAFVRQNIYQNIGSLVPKNDRYFISRQDTKNILRTNSTKLKEAFDAIQRSNLPLEFGVDFYETNKTRFYSLNALYRFSQALSDEDSGIALKEKHRRDWCSTVETVGNDVFTRIENQDQKELERTIRYVRRTRDKQTCQITGKKRTPATPTIKMAVHHLFSKEDYSALSADPDKMITIEQTLHENFHAWNGGTSVPCTIDDFIRFLNEQYPEHLEASHKLNLLRIKLYHKMVTLRTGFTLPPSY